MKVFSIGFCFGLLLPVLGLFVGLQISPNLADLMMFPVRQLTALANQPFGELPAMTRLVLWSCAGTVWGLIFLSLHWLWGKLSR